VKQPRFLSYRLTPQRLRWLNVIAQRLGLQGRSAYASAIDFALQALVSGLTEAQPLPRKEDPNTHDHDQG